jgi:hypothetical protein
MGNFYGRRAKVAAFEMYFDIFPIFKDLLCPHHIVTFLNSSQVRLNRLEYVYTPFLPIGKPSLAN